MQIRSPYAHNKRPDFKGCNELIAKFKELVPIGVPMMLRTGRSGTLVDSKLSEKKIYYLLEKKEHFAICGVKLPSGKFIRECFSYHELLLQHGQVAK